MVELWACIGLACIDKNFLDRLQGKVLATTREYGFRLSYIELAYLESLLADDKIVECMRIIYPRGCRPPIFCTGFAKHAISEGYDRFKEWFQANLERPGE